MDRGLLPLDLSRYYSILTSHTLKYIRSMGLFAWHKANGEIMISKKIEQALEYECKEKAESQAAKLKLDLENTLTIVQGK